MLVCKSCKKQFSNRGQLLLHMNLCEFEKHNYKLPTASSFVDKITEDNSSASSPVRSIPDMDSSLLEHILGEFSDDSDKDPSWEPVEDDEEDDDDDNDAHHSKKIIASDFDIVTLPEDMVVDPAVPSNCTAVVVSSAFPVGPTLNGVTQVELGRVSKPKRTKGVRKREEERKKKEQGLAYINRSGKVFQAKTFLAITKCCRLKCEEKCNPEKQLEIFNAFIKKPKEVKDEILSSRISICEKNVTTIKKTNTGKTHKREITVKYMLTVGTSQIIICKKMFISVYGITAAKVNYVIQKLRSSLHGFHGKDQRGQHTPKNKLVEERIQIRAFIEKYPKNESHYARRDCPHEIYLPSHLNINMMYDEYRKIKIENGETKIACYDVFRDVFKQTGYKFKQPYLDTCKTCDQFISLKRHASNKQIREEIAEKHNIHVLEAQKGYDSKTNDKMSAKEQANQTVLVFDLQQVLSSPFLSTNIVYYKRLLSVYNLTIRDCSSTESSECYMWHEATGGRGSNDIASCVYKKIMNLPPHIEHVITYSDAAGGQNRNINMACMFTFVLKKKPTLKLIDQKFLLSGHTRLECDSDHSRIEKAKKKINGGKMKIMVPRDWFQFVSLVRGQKPFKVVRMGQSDFFAFSKLLSNALIHRKEDTDGNKVKWLKVRWLRYTNDFGVIQYKYSLDEDEPFKILNLKRDKIKRGKLSKQLVDNCDTNAPTISHSYSHPLGINPLKKQDLLSLLPLIDEECRDFYRNLPISGRALEFDELEDQVDEADLNS